jgi:hypothetical protein
LVLPYFWNVVSGQQYFLFSWSKCNSRYSDATHPDAILQINLFVYFDGDKGIIKARRAEMIITMSGTFSQIYIQIVFAVKGRQNLIDKIWQTELHKYISGIITAKGQKSIIVNGVADHIHCFIGLKPSIAISDLVRDIKTILLDLLMKKDL